MRQGLTRATVMVLALLLLFAVPAMAAGAADGLLVGMGGLRVITVPDGAKVTTGITLKEHEKTLSAGQIYEVKGTITTRGEKDPVKQAVYNLKGEKDSSVVAYTGRGTKFKAVAPGVAVVTLQSGAYKDSVTVTVLPVPTSVTFDKSELALKVGQAEALTATVLPEGTEQRVAWSTSNASVAAVTQSGVVTARKKGTARITAKTINGKTVSCKVVVSAGTIAPVKYRALCIGTGIGEKNDTKLFPADAREFANMLRLNSFDGAQMSVKLLANPPTKAAAMTGIRNAFKGSTENDVNYLYLMTHGAPPTDSEYSLMIGSKKGQTITSKELRQLLDKIPGKMVLIIDSCFSGDVIGKNAAPANWTNGFVNSFTAGSAVTKSGEMKAEKYKVICGSTRAQQSWVKFEPSDLNGAYSLSGSVVAMGAGWNYQNQPKVRPHKTEMLADKNGDGRVTLAETYVFADPLIKKFYADWGIAGVDTPGATPTQICVWPENDDFPIFSRK